MSIEAIQFLPAVGLPQIEGIAGTPAAPSGDFGAWFTNQMSQVNQQLVNADHGIQQLAAGDASNLHQVMINLEEAKLSMQLVMQVRTHLLDAYHDLMQMQM
jgi:flagellar hook-basal body complex protein FliE